MLQNQVDKATAAAVRTLGPRAMMAIAQQAGRESTDLGRGRLPGNCSILTGLVRWNGRGGAARMYVAAWREGRNRSTRAAAPKFPVVTFDATSGRRRESCDRHARKMAHALRIDLCTVFHGRTWDLVISSGRSSGLVLTRVTGKKRRNALLEHLLHLGDQTFPDLRVATCGWQAANPRPCWADETTITA